MSNTRGRLVATGLLLGATTMTGCSSSDPLDRSGSGSTIVVGSQDYYSSEILAEIYAQALEADGIPVERDLRVGQREVYVPELESGRIDVFPEYSGPLLQYWEPDTSARTAADVHEALVGAAPDGLRVLAQSAATDQDAYVVTRVFAERYDVDDVGDLARVEVPLTMGGNSEGEDRPNGPRGLRSAYGVDVDFTPIEDGGGPLTVKALKDGDIQLAVLYTASPILLDPDLVVLDDPEHLLLASHVVPVVSDRLDADAVAVLESVSAALSAEDLVRLNAESVEEKVAASVIAERWLASEGLVG